MYTRVFTVATGYVTILLFNIRRQRDQMEFPIRWNRINRPSEPFKSASDTLEETTQLCFIKTNKPENISTGEKTMFVITQRFICSGNYDDSKKPVDYAKDLRLVLSATSRNLVSGVMKIHVNGNLSV